MDTAPVSLKGFGDGLRLTISPTLPEDQVLDRITPLFSQVGKLAEGARINVVADTRSHAFLESLRTFLMSRFLVSEVRSDEIPSASTQEERKRMREAHRPQMPKTRETLMMHGRIRSGQKVESKGHLVLVGDVNPGAEILAGGDILVIGTLCGQAHAGQPDNREAIIWAKDFRPQQIRIADCVAAGQQDSGKSAAPEFAKLENDRLVVAPHGDPNPFAKLPWPVNR